MPKVTLDMNTFKALASDSRLDILRSLDGKKMSLKDISRATRLNKATLHEHLAKLNEAGLVKKYEREGHKWVYYKLTWKGEGLLHPENTRIVVMFSITFVTLLIGIMLITSFVQPITIGKAVTIGDTTHLYEVEDEGIPLFSHSYNYRFIAEVEIKEETVKDMSAIFQSNAQVSDNFGNVYSVDEIAWYTPSNAQLSANQSILVKQERSFSLTPGDPYNKSGDYYNDSYNETVKNGESIDYIAAVPEMIAKTQNQDYLFAAVVCMTTFGVLFTLSSWRLWKSRKPKL